MNFSTHKQQIVDSIEIALTKDKIDLIERFKLVLNQCRSLFKSTKFDFWLRQLGTIPHNEIPLTKFGLENAHRSAKHLPDCDRNSFENRVESICEQLFTYSHRDDLCLLQCEYHYYFYLREHKTFKESGMGYSDLDQERVSSSEIRIARISEIEANSSEYL